MMHRRAEFSEGHLHQLEAKFHFSIRQEDQSTFKTIYPLDRCFERFRGERKTFASTSQIDFDISQVTEESIQVNPLSSGADILTAFN